tara:strand:- start:27 stop:869 length:843 start_codon:yes stop_codon:yes gene_type:complete
MDKVNYIGDWNREAHTRATDYILKSNLTSLDEDITIIPDGWIIPFIEGKIITSPTSKKIAQFQEPLTISNQKLILRTLLDNYSKFDTILGWHDELFHLPNFKFKPATEITQFNTLPELLPVEEFKIHSKSKLLSFITSNKLMTQGHNFRLQCLQHLHSNLCKFDLYGRGFNPISTKLLGLKDYNFSITIENGYFKNGYTEKIIDCFLTGTVPIYYGCPNVADFYNPKGILQFNSLEELLYIVNNISESQYNDMLPYIKENLEIALDDYQTNNRIYNKFIK